MTPLRSLLILSWLLTESGAVLAQTSEEEHTSRAEHSRFVVAGFLGSTQAHGNHESTIALEGGFHLNETWSIGAVWERANREKDSTLTLVGLGWHPLGPELRIQFGLGKKDPADKKENVFRTGIGYEIELTEEWFVKPYFAVDFIEHEDTERVYGLYFGRSF